ncbi:CHAT domain-containing tetratricopeptide repeat protein [Candidatus Thiodictyon syntrophicum]|jgi:CHAT domain-containing protein/tetratricopeptide (TPR) repeat protein|uniref:CHAT domain-containing protein n=1 Tax=Candidatus Thiodictyon syntrophicum TaxID=1166950 RepID=A0A2K8UDY5_9GAMM|nr:CHAT domain-containing protein [Candidatus Thiodictyon syntrophicum]AUB83301.1 hypothetical protein THSYN_21710 [Candidatus Thiodictyon syntrophicum]
MSDFVRTLALVFALILAGPVGGGEDGGEQALIDEVTAALREQTGVEPDAVAVVDVLNRITVGLLEEGRHADAEPFARIALDHGERVLGAEHPDTLASVNNLAGLYYSQGRYGEAEPLLRRALEARERVLGPNHPDTLSSVNNLAGLYLTQGRYSEAEPLCYRGFVANERALGAEHPQTLKSAAILASLYYFQARFGEAEPLLRRTLEASERVLGHDNPDTLSSVNNLASLYLAQGRYGEAEPLLRRTFEASERVLGAEHPDTLSSVNNLAELYRTQDRNDEAESFYRRALETSTRVLGAEHPQTLQSANNLALLYTGLGRYAEAEPLYRRTLAARERVLGAEHPDTLQSANNLAGLYQDQGSYEKAERLYRQTLHVCERVLGVEHPHTLTSVNNLAGLYWAKGRYRDAELLLRRALGISERVLGEYHPNTIRVQGNLAPILVNQGRLAPALAELRVIDGRLRTFVGRQLDTTGSELVRRQWLVTESGLQDIVFTLALAHPDSAALPLAADILLRWKRLAGDEEAVIARLTRTSRDPRVMDLGGRLRQARSELSRLVNLPKPDPKVTAAELAELERLETELAGLSRRFRGQVAGRSVEWESVQAALPRGAALLELRAFKPVDFKTGKFGEDRWLAVLTSAQPAAETDTGSHAGKRSGKKKPKEPPTLRIFDLGPVSATTPLQADLTRLTREALCLNQLLAAPDPRPACADALDPAAPAKPEEVRARLAAVNQSADESARTLYRTLFGALDKTLAGFSILYLAPDGALDLMPFARLKLPDGRYWVERQSLRELGTGRDLLPLEAGGEAVGMIAMGGVDYERFPAAEAGVEATAVVGAPGRDAPAPLNERLRAERGSFKPLPQTGPEAAAVGRSFWDYFNRKARVLTGPEAAESSLSAITEPPLVLHLATHGFFLAARADGTDRPLTLAGLALAGANLGLTGKLGPGHQDGILYALEAQDLNLEGTRLVTLSACDTGRGALDRSEGVYGLVRAFQIAGAQAVLMSLWPLDDALAAEFMGDFYRRWLSAGPNSDPSDALRAARLGWIGDKADPRRQDPAYWAPFVLVERR